MLFIYVAKIVVIIIRVCVTILPRLNQSVLRHERIVLFDFKQCHNNLFPRQSLLNVTEYYSSVKICFKDKWPSATSSGEADRCAWRNASRLGSPSSSEVCEIATCNGVVHNPAEASRRAHALKNERFIVFILSPDLMWPAFQTRRR